MRSIKFSLSKKPVNAWDAAVLLVEAYFSAKLKSDQVLDLLPNDFIGQRRASCQSLFLGALRHGHRSRAAFKPMLRKTPRPIVEAILLVAGYEFYSEPSERHPKIVHHAVERSKKLVNRFEQGFLNAVLRKLPAAIEKIDPDSSTADFYSHPDWLVNHWSQSFGEDATRELLEWNQQIPEQTIRIYDPPKRLPEFLTPTPWDGFYRISRSVDWQHQVAPLLDGSAAYIKDPSTRLASALLGPSSGMDVLDLCAAPGGKSYDMAHQMHHSGRIVAVDLPGSRVPRLRENFSKLTALGLEAEAVECDVLQLNKAILEERNLPTRYDGVMLDAPCSNTGVIQRRTDVKWRLRPKDIQECAQLQLELLIAASGFVKDGGRLVYSTCSIEEEENRSVVDHFLHTEAGSQFRLEDQSISLPWETGHDGAGAFLLIRTN
ncbi:RNA methyltransferase [Coraliomargarita sinensis]|uniref:RNA methyltransferase n=1 Tax=Coraliomargarita sinensis TaxID=2174842 RepID=A0A317ZF87_9BACT|nr:RsmB/NOP family class I SAM-dependent RNA methyltransferase [Coraliomargarita sinensis]PXA04234.1 RNA methyltransferase [Coraliomargarita sinensis]